MALLGIAAWVTYGLIEYTIEAMPFPGTEDVGADPTTITFLVPTSAPHSER